MLTDNFQLRTPLTAHDNDRDSPQWQLVVPANPVHTPLLMYNNNK